MQTNNYMSVIHLAAEPEGLIQKCALCGFVLSDYTDAMSIGDWRPLWWKGSVEVKDGFRGAVLDQPNCIDADLKTIERQSDGVDLIAAERLRQLEFEGWTADHDDEHTDGSLALAAISYIWHHWSDSPSILMLYWPWKKEWWKPKDHISNLVRAGALIAAEIDRLKRIENKKEN